MSTVSRASRLDLESRSIYLHLSSITLNFLYSPNGMKCRSKPELARILGKNFDLSSFDYRSGRVLQSAIRKSKRLKGSSYDYARGKLMCRWS